MGPLDFYIPHLYVSKTSWQTTHRGLGWAPYLFSHQHQHQLSTELCAKPPALLYVHTWFTHHSNTIVKFADYTTVLGLIYESPFRDKVERLTAWCTNNNLLLNTTKTKVIVVDYRKKKTDIKPLHIRGDCVERVSDFRFPGVHMTEDLS